MEQLMIVVFISCVAAAVMYLGYILYITKDAVIPTKYRVVTWTNFGEQKRYFRVQRKLPERGWQDLNKTLFHSKEDAVMQMVWYVQGMHRVQPASDEYTGD